LADGLFLFAQGAAGAFLFIGLVVAVRGALFKPRVKVKCDICNTEVVAVVEQFQLKCGNGNHRVRRRILPVILLLMFFAAAAAEAAIVIYGSLVG
jgi:hypothetical protein